MTTAADVTLPPLAMFIDGTWREASEAGALAVINPATEATIAEIPLGGEADVDAAVAAARAQFAGGEWSRVSGPDRGRIADLIEADAENLAALEALDVGKPVGDPAAIDIPLSAETFRHFAGWADKLFGSTVPVPDFLGRPRFSSHAARAGRRRRSDHPVECADDDRQLEDRPSAGRGLHSRGQAVRGRAAVHAVAGRAVRGGPGCPPAWSTW